MELSFTLRGVQDHAKYGRSSSLCSGLNKLAQDSKTMVFCINLECSRFHEWCQDLSESSHTLDTVQLPLNTFTSKLSKLTNSSLVHVQYCLYSGLLLVYHYQGPRSLWLWPVSLAFTPHHKKRNRSQLDKSRFGYFWPINGSVASARRASI